MERIIIETEIGLGDWVETVYGDIGAIEAIGIMRNGAKIFNIQSGIGANDWLYDHQIYRKMDRREIDKQHSKHLKEALKLNEYVTVSKS